MTSTNVRTNDLIISPITGAPSAITWHIEIIPFPISVNTAGIKAATPVIIIVKEATTAVAPAAPAAANDVKPIANAERPVPAAISPAPIAKTDTPTKVKAPANPIIVGRRGLRIAPATPRIVNAPAKTIRLLANDFQDFLERVAKTGTNKFKAETATSNEADPDNVPFIKFKAIDSSAKAPPKTVKPFPIDSHCIEPKLDKASAKTFKAAPTTRSPVPINISPLGIRFTEAATSAKAPPIAVSPLPMDSQFIEPKSDTAEANIFIEIPISTNAEPVDITCLAFPVRFVNTAISANNAPILPRPFSICFTLNCPKSLQEDANTFIAAANITMPVAVVVVFKLNFAKFKKAAISAINTPTAINPLAICFQLSSDKSLHTDANILIAAANITSPVAPLMIFFFCVDITFANIVTVAVKPVIPISPLAIPFQSSSARFFKDPASIFMDIDIAIIIVEVLNTLFGELLILPKMAIAPIKFTKSIVMPPIDADNLSLSINDKATIDADNMPIAIAILIRVPAFNCV